MKRNARPTTPAWVSTISVSRSSEEGEIRYCTLDNKAALIWAANLASIELHVLLSQEEQWALSDRRRV